MIVSFPPETISPSGYVADGGRHATALTNVVPCDEMIPSYFGGAEDMTFHTRTVASREAEIMVLEAGNVTDRTC
jgi:hypothetical protein